jgi:hypothetical protein
MNKPRFLVLTGMIVLAATSRLIPHPPNFTPVAAMALFGGATFAERRLAFFVPFAALFLSDVAMGYSPSPVVYGSFALIVSIGLCLRTRRTPLAIAGGALAGSILFFVTTNFGVWAFGSLYQKTASGLIECYVAAIPFFRNTLLSDAIYNAILFGGFALAEARFPLLRIQRVSTATI